MGNQIWTIPVSPAQRLVLLNLAFGEGQKLQGQQGRTFRRFVRAFKIDRLRDVLAQHENRIRADIFRAPRAVLEIPEESGLYALQVTNAEHKPSEEMEIGPLVDALEDAKAGREVDVAGLRAYDEALDDWTPVDKIQDPVEATAQRIEGMLRAAGETRAADFVARGHWDTPGPQAQPAEASAPADA